MNRRTRTIASYVCFVLAALSLVGAPLLSLVGKPLPPVGLALAVMFIGTGWLAMAPEEGADSGRPMALFLGRLLFSAGLLFALLCGACTLLFWGLFIPPTLTHAVPEHRTLTPTGVFGAIMLPLVVGGIPFAIGIGVLVLGRWLIGTHKRKAQESGS